MSANDDDDGDRKPSARKSFDGGGDIASPPPLLPLPLPLMLLLSLSLLPRVVVGNSRPQIVNIRTYDTDTCSAECTGTLITTIVVLTSATCVVASRDGQPDDYGDASTTTDQYTDENTNETEPGHTPRTTPTTKSLLSARSIFVKSGDIKVYHLDNPSDYRNVSHKYVHPEWNPTTYVADVALLKIDVGFHNLGGIIVMPEIMDINFGKLPETLKFVGFGKIKPDGKRILKPGDKITDGNTLRTLKVKFTSGLCPAIVNGSSTDDKNWWSFLCTPAQDVRTKDTNTLCAADKGGPLYDNDPKNGRLRMFAIFSHVYHIKFPFCATQTCSLTKDNHFPCNEKDSIYYRHTALIGRFASWVNRTVEWDSRSTTNTPTTEECLTEPGTSSATSSTTIDPMYDEDEYKDVRKMVTNRPKVCRKFGCKSALAAAATSVLDGPWPLPLPLLSLSLSASFFFPPPS